MIYINTQCKLYLVIWILFIILFLVSNCANFSTFQTARTVPPSSYRMSIGTGYITSIDSSDSTSSSYSPLQLVITGRSGLAKKLDMGLKSTILGGTSIDLKYQFVDFGMLSAAIGGEVGYMKLKDKINNNEPLYIELIPPPSLYVGFDPLDWLGFYSSIKFIILSRLDTNESQKKYIVNSLGLRLGNSLGVFFELNLINNLPLSLAIFQIGMSLFFGDAPSAGYFIPRDKVKTKDIINPTYSNLSERTTEYDLPRIKYVSARYRVIVITHDFLRAWKIGDEVCAINGGINIACGKVKKVTPAGAVVKIRGKKSALVPGMEVRLKENE